MNTHKNPIRSLQVAVVGGGPAGLMAARTLKDRGVAVTVFDKGRRPGGRTNTRAHGDYRFDHGSPYLAVRADLVRTHLKTWLEAGVVAEWRGRLVRLDGDVVRPLEGETRYVGVPGMVSIAEHLAADLDVRTGVRVAGVEGEAGAWTLVDDTGLGHGPFAWVVVAVPAPQAAPLLDGSPELQGAALNTEMTPSWALMLAFEERIDVRFDAAFIPGSPIVWLARNSSKPGRPAVESWVAHTTPGWTREHLEDPADAIPDLLLPEIAHRLGALPALRFKRAHRWGFARLAGAGPGRALFDAQTRLAICGDWCGDGRLEGALLTGIQAGTRVADQVGEAPLPA